jgi:hypothetical protein
MVPNTLAFENVESSDSTEVKLAVECFATNPDGGYNAAIQIYNIYNNQLYPKQKIVSSKVMYSTKMIF